MPPFEGGHIVAHKEANNELNYSTSGFCGGASWVDPSVAVGSGPAMQEKSVTPKAQKPWAPQARKMGELGSRCLILSKKTGVRAHAQRIEEAVFRK